MIENRNLVLAIVLSATGAVRLGIFRRQPQMQAERARQAYRARQQARSAPRSPRRRRRRSAAIRPRRSAAQPGARSSRDARVAIDTPTLDGSLRLKGARFDDLRLKNYRETIDPKSPEIMLFSPERTRYPYYAVFGWVGAPGRA